MKVDERVARLMAGSEPEFGFMPPSIGELAIAYSWYAQNKDKKVADDYLEAYCKKNNINVSSSIIQSQPATLGFTCRMISRGANLTEESKKWMDLKFQGMKDYSYTDPFVSTSVPIQDKPKPTVQDYITEQVRVVLGQLDGMIDDFILSDYKNEQSPDAVLMEHNMKGVHTSRIVDYYKKQRDEIRAALDRTDEQIAEGYASFYRPNLKKLESYLDKIIGSALQLQTKAMSTRAPRKTKPKSPEKLTGKLKYASGISELKITSVPAKKLVDAEALWVFNVKTRKLGVYYAEDRRGLSLKGQTILNYSESRSICKKVRKPDQMLPDFLATRKNGLDKFLDNIIAVESPMSGRINKDTVLLRVIEY